MVGHVGIQKKVSQIFSLLISIFTTVTKILLLSILLFLTDSLKIKT